VGSEANEQCERGGEGERGGTRGVCTGFNIGNVTTSPKNPINGGTPAIENKEITKQLTAAIYGAAIVQCRPNMIG
jgi:hypothetical protein